MDIASLILAAIVGGLTSGVSDTTSLAIKDGYEKIKNSLLRKSGANSVVLQHTIDNLEANPSSEIYKAALKEEILKVGLDEELINLAQTLLDAREKVYTSTAKYGVSVTNSEGIVIGEKSKVIQKFSTTKKHKARKRS